MPYRGRTFGYFSSEPGEDPREKAPESYSILWLQKRTICCWQALMEKQGSVDSQILTLPVCCVCGLIRDEDKDGPSIGNWVTKQTYRKIHGVDPAMCRLTHTYCPTCYAQFMNRIVAA